MCMRVSCSSGPQFSPGGVLAGVLSWSIVCRSRPCWNLRLLSRPWPDAPLVSRFVSGGVPAGVPPPGLTREILHTIEQQVFCTGTSKHVATFECEVRGCACDGAWLCIDHPIVHRHHRPIDPLSPTLRIIRRVAVQVFHVRGSELDVGFDLGVACQAAPARDAGILSKRNSQGHDSLGEVFAVRKGMQGVNMH